jgi:hypothetical protein
MLAGLTTSQAALPCLISLPMPLAAYALESPRTPWELFKPTEEDAALLRLWLMGSLQTKAGRTAPAWVLDLHPVVAMDPTFMEWCYHHMSSIVGKVAKQNPTAGQQDNAGPPLELSLT